MQAQWRNNFESNCNVIETSLQFLGASEKGKTPLKEISVYHKIFQHITRPWPKWVERKIHPCSLRVNELSEPNMLRLLNNFDFHLDHLSIFQIENYLKKITKGDYTTPEAALHMLKQSVQDRQKSVCRQRKEEKKFNEKLAEKHADDLKQIASCAIKHFEDIILDPQPLKPSEELTKYSEVILGNICRLLRQNVPSRDSENFKEQILCKIADKVAFCMIEFIKQSDFKNPPTFKIKTCEQFIKKCNPIEEIQREDKSFSSDGDVEGDQVQSKTDLGKENNDKAQGSGLNKQASNTSPVDKERKLSFLRLSQINFDGLNCGEENEKAEEMRAQRATERAAKSAAKASRKLGRQNAKKAKNAKKGGEGAQDDDCLGNADKRPQWEVEWVDRS